VSVREATRERTIYLAASDEWDSVANTSAAFDVARRDRLAAAGAHTDSAAGGVSSSSDAELIKNSFAKNFCHGILRAG
jgi:hypothetical protein